MVEGWKVEGGRVEDGGMDGGGVEGGGVEGSHGNAPAAGQRLSGGLKKVLKNR